MKMLSAPELAERWQLHQRTLRRWRQHGNGPHFFKKGNRVFYWVTDVEAFENHCTQTITSR